MARKRSAKKKSSGKRKQGRRSNEVEDTAAQAGESNHRSSSMPLTSPTPAGQFFSPPAADLGSLQSPVARPINTPYSTRRTRLGSADSSSIASSIHSPSPSRVSSTRSGNRQTPSSVSSSPQQSGPLAEQVRDLNHLLTSPLVVHLGDLANNDTNALGRGMSDDEDDMSQEWDHLAQAESMLREELEALAAPDSIPPTIARQRLDPLSSPLNPFNLFAGGEEKKEHSPPAIGGGRRKLDVDSAMSPARSYANKFDESDQYAADIQARLALGGSKDSLEESTLSSSGASKLGRPQEINVRVKSLAKMQMEKASSSPAVGSVLSGSCCSATSSDRIHSHYPSLMDSNSSSDGAGASVAALNGSSGSSERIVTHYYPRATFSQSADEMGDLIPMSSSGGLHFVAASSGSSDRINSQYPTTSSSSDEYGPRMAQDMNIETVVARPSREGQPMEAALIATAQSSDQGQDDARYLQARQQRPPPSLASLKGKHGELPPTIHAALQIAAAYDSVGSGSVEDEILEPISPPIPQVSQEEEKRWKDERREAERRQKQLTQQGDSKTNQSLLEMAASIQSADSEDNHVMQELPSPSRVMSAVQRIEKFQTPMVDSGRNKRTRTTSKKSTVKFQTPMDATRVQNVTSANSSDLARFYTPMVGRGAPASAGIDTGFHTAADTGYHTAIQSSRFDDYEDLEDRSQRTDLGKELDKLVHSLPMFSPAQILDDLESTTPSRNRTFSNDRSLDSNDSADFVDPEISQLVHAVQEQLDQSSTLTEDTPITLEQIEGQLSSLSSVNNTTKSRQSPELSEGILQVVTGDEESLGMGTLHRRFQIGTIESNDFENETDEDDNMGYELNLLESSQHALRQALEVSAEEYALPSKASMLSKSPPQITNEVMYVERAESKGLAHPVPFLHPKKDSTVTSPNHPHSVAPTTTTVATSIMTGTFTESNHQDLNYYHERDPEPQMSHSTSPDLETKESIFSSLSDDGVPTGSHLAVGSMSDCSISTIGHGHPSATPASEHRKASPSKGFLKKSENIGIRGHSLMGSPAAALSLQQKLNQFSPVSQASSAGTPVLRRSPESHVSFSKSPLPSKLSPDSDRNSLSTSRLVLSPEDGACSVATSTSTPKMSGRGYAPSRNSAASCSALNHLVRSPSDDSTEGSKSGSRPPYQFVEDNDTSSESSPPMVPFAPDEWAFRNTRATTLAAGRWSESHRSTIEKTEEPPLASSRGSIRNEIQRNGSHSQSRMKEPNSKKFELQLKRVEKRQRDFRSDSALSIRSNPEQTDTDMPVPRRVRVGRMLQSFSASLREGADSDKQPSLRRKEAAQPNTGSAEGSPLSVKTADAWMIKSRADGGGSTVALNSALFDLGDSRPRQSVPSHSTNSIVDSPRTKSRKKIATTGSALPHPFDDMMMPRSPESDDRDDVDVEDPGSKKLLQDKEGEESEKKTDRSSRNCMLCVAVGCVWVLFLAAIILLGVFLIRSPDDPDHSTRIDDVSSAATILPSTPEPTIAPTVGPPTPPTLPPIVTAIASLPPVEPSLPPSSPTTAPMTNENVMITGTPTASTGVPATLATPQPTSNPPTNPPTLSPLASNSTLKLISLIVARSVDGGAALLDRTSPEYASLHWLSTNTLIDSYTAQQKIQRFVLGTVYYGMGGVDWTDNARWMTDWDECKWFSRSRRDPVCNQNGEFVNLDLGYLDVSGSLPKALGMLSNSLRRIDIHGGPTAYIAGTIPSELGLLTLMRELRLSQNEMSGSVPVELRRWSFLETLDLHGNNFRGSLPFNHPFWPALTTVDLGENFFVGSIPTTIGRHAGISKLLLQDNLLNAAIPSQIGLLSNLRDLYLDQNNFQSFPTELGRLKQLENLMIAANKLRNTLPTELGLLTHLRSLSLTLNDIQGEIPSEIGQLVQLRDRIDLSYNELTGTVPSEVGGLTKMKHLLLHTNNLSGSLPEEVAALHRLNTLRIDDNAMSGRVGDEICGVFNHTLPYFYADCTEIDCPCCIFCCQDSSGCACRYENSIDQYLCY